MSTDLTSPPSKRRKKNDDRRPCREMTEEEENSLIGKFPSLDGIQDTKAYRMRRKLLLRQTKRDRNLTVFNLDQIILQWQTSLRNIESDIFNNTAPYQHPTPAASAAPGLGFAASYGGAGGAPMIVNGKIKIDKLSNTTMPTTPASQPHHAGGIPATPVPPSTPMPAAATPFYPQFTPSTVPPPVGYHPPPQTAAAAPAYYPAMAGYGYVPQPQPHQAVPVNAPSNNGTVAQTMMAKKPGPSAANTAAGSSPNQASQQSVSSKNQTTAPRPQLSSTSPTPVDGATETAGGNTADTADGSANPTKPEGGNDTAIGDASMPNYDDADGYQPLGTVKTYSVPNTTTDEPKNESPPQTDTKKPTTMQPPTNASIPHPHPYPQAHPHMQMVGPHPYHHPPPPPHYMYRVPPHPYYQPPPPHPGYLRAPPAGAIPPPVGGAGSSLPRESSLSRLRHPQLSTVTKVSFTSKTAAPATASTATAATGSTASAAKSKSAATAPTASGTTPVPATPALPNRQIIPPTPSLIPIPPPPPSTTTPANHNAENTAAKDDAITIVPSSVTTGRSTPPPSSNTNTAKSTPIPIRTSRSISISGSSSSTAPASTSTSSASSGGTVSIPIAAPTAASSTAPTRPISIVESTTTESNKDTSNIIAISRSRNKKPSALSSSVSVPVIVVGAPPQPPPATYSNRSVSPARGSNGSPTNKVQVRKRATSNSPPKPNNVSVGTKSRTADGSSVVERPVSSPAAVDPTPHLILPRPLAPTPSPHAQMNFASGARVSSPVPMSARTAVGHYYHHHPQHQHMQQRHQNYRFLQQHGGGRYPQQLSNPAAMQQSGRGGRSKIYAPHTSSGGTKRGSLQRQIYNQQQQQLYNQHQQQLAAVAAATATANSRNQQQQQQQQQEASNNAAATDPLTLAGYSSGADRFLDGIYHSDNDALTSNIAESILAQRISRAGDESESEISLERMSDIEMESLMTDSEYSSRNWYQQQQQPQQQQQQQRPRTPPPSPVGMLLDHRLQSGSLSDFEPHDLLQSVDAIYSNDSQEDTFVVTANGTTADTDSTPAEIIREKLLQEFISQPTSNSNEDESKDVHMSDDTREAKSQNQQSSEPTAVSHNEESNNKEDNSNSNNNVDEERKPTASEGVTHSDMLPLKYADNNLL